MTPDELRDRIAAALRHQYVRRPDATFADLADAVMADVREGVAAELDAAACTLAAAPRVPLNVARYLRDLASRWRADQ